MMPIYFYNKEGTQLLFRFLFLFSKLKLDNIQVLTLLLLKESQIIRFFIYTFLLSQLFLFQVRMLKILQRISKKSIKENKQENLYSFSIQKPILCTNTLDPSLTFTDNSRGKVCKKLTELEGKNIPTKTVFTRLQDGKLYLNK